MAWDWPERWAGGGGIDVDKSLHYTELSGGAALVRLAISNSVAKPPAQLDILCSHGLTQWPSQKINYVISNKIVGFSKLSNGILGRSSHVTEN